MTDKQLAKQFEEVRHAYATTFLVKHTEAFRDFCFTNSDHISKLLAKGARKAVKTAK